ncbi:MAG: outer membrane beta-barrel protein [Parvularculaceae bacterium]
MKLFASAIMTTLLAGASAWAVESGPFQLAMLRDNDIDTMRVAQASTQSQYKYADQRRPALREASQTLFIRGGYSFAASGQGLADGAGAPLYSAGYRARISERLPISFEGEVVFQRDTDPVLIGIGQEDATRRAVSGLIGLRYDGPKFGPVRPFFSGAVGPVHVKTQIDNGVTPLAASNIELGYGARAGLSLPVNDRWAIEAGYRLLGATNDDIKTHSAELGVSWRF